MINVTQQDIIQKLNKPLLGWNAHKIMAPKNRAEQLKTAMEAHVDARQSAVLILLYQKNGDWFIPLIERSVYPGVHSGQISLPGGKVESQDVNFEATALREAQEEIGVQPESIDLIGSLSELYIPPSNFNVKPFVGFYKNSIRFTAQEHEVQRIIEIPLRELLSDGIIQEKDFGRSTNNIVQKAPYFHLQGVEIWGATAMILNEFRLLTR